MEDSVTRAIRAITKTCRDEKVCHIVVLGRTTTLLAYEHGYYDKHGEYHVNPNPNEVETAFYCRTCEKSWTWYECMGRGELTEGVDPRMSIRINNPI